MITLYTALGKYAKNQDKSGIAGLTVTVNKKKHSLVFHEALIYISLSGRILTYDEAKAEFYEKERDAHILGELGFDHYLNRLAMRGLVASGRDITGMDALYDLLGHLYIHPAKHFLWRRLAVYRGKRLEPMEKKLLRLCCDRILSTAELMQCLDSGKLRLRSNRELIDCLYHDEDTDYKNITIPARFAAVHTAVLSAVANLYLNKVILLEN